MRPDPDLLTSVFANNVARPQLKLRDWEVLLGQARRSVLISRLGEHFANRGWLEAIPPQPKRHLFAAGVIAERQRLQTQWEVDCIERALHRIDTPVVLLKGAAYVVAKLPPARGRLFGDVDILVRQDRLAEVENALFAAGWIPQERDAYNDRYYRKWMHEIPPLIHASRGSALDVHHTITPPTSRFRVDATKLFAQMCAVGNSGRLFVLSPTDMVLHSAVHLFQEGEFEHGLRDLLDMGDLLRHFGAEDGYWSRLFERADELGLERPLYYALSQLERLFPESIPEGASNWVRHHRPSFVVSAVMSFLLTHVLRPHHPSCDDLTCTASRWIMYMRAHFLRMPVYLLVPHLVRKAYMRRFPKVAPVGQDAAP